MNEERNALNDDDLEQVTGGKGLWNKIFSRKGTKITATAGGRAAMEAEADVKGYEEATGRLW